MKRTLAIALAVTGLVVIFVGLRVYGAYHSERENALTRAADADKQADALELEGKRLDAQNKCNDQWQKYEIAKTEKRIAELKGQIARSPVEPSCTGYAPRIDEALKQVFKAGEANLEAASIRGYAKFERNYAVNRNLQTRYLGLRLWAFLTGTELKPKQAEMERDQEYAASLASCLTNAKKDIKLESECNEIFGKK